MGWDLDGNLLGLSGRHGKLLKTQTTEVPQSQLKGTISLKRRQDEARGARPIIDALGEGCRSRWGRWRGGGRCVTRVAVVGCSDLIQLSHHVIYYRTAVTLVAE